jgi:hypothetical protein
MNFNEESEKVGKENAGVIAESLLNCSFYEMSTMVREEGIKTSAALLEVMGENLKDYIQIFIDCGWFHLCDQATMVKMGSAQLLNQILK